MTLPTSDAQSSSFRSRRPHTPVPTSPPYSMPTLPAVPLSTPKPMPPTPNNLPPVPSTVGTSEDLDHDRAIDFASHSWDLATGGLKTLTAKREMPSLNEQQATEKMAGSAPSVPRSYMFLLIVLICLVIMLISGGIVLIVMLQS